MTATMLISRHNAASGNHSYDLESWKNANTQAGSQYRKRLSFLQQKEACSMKKYLVRHNAASGNHSYNPAEKKIVSPDTTVRHNAASGYHSYDSGSWDFNIGGFHLSQYRKRLSFLRHWEIVTGYSLV